MSLPQEIRTERLRLRPWGPGDLAPFAGLNADPRVMEKLGMIHNRDDDFDHPLLPAGHWLSRHVLYRASCRDWSGKQALDALTH